MDLPSADNFKEIQASIKKNGRLKTFKDQIQSNWLLIIFLIYVGYDQKLYDKFVNVEHQAQAQQQTMQLEINEKVSSEQHTVEDRDSNTLGASSEFNSDEWYIESFQIDKEGFYCPTTNKFEYWSIWSKNTYSPNVNKIKIRLLVKSKQGSDLPPTLVISYGEFKPSYSPIQFYRLNIFDTDLKSLRLYNNNEDSVAQGYFTEEPELGSEMSVTLSPRSIDPNSRVLNLNPYIEYASPNKGKLIVYTPDENSAFQVTLPTVGIEDGTVKKQIGIGSSKESCFKPIAIEISE